MEHLISTFSGAAAIVQRLIRSGLNILFLWL
uniref:Uncharacterized protein n=1 Tax=Anguilla anguilla TaxID=7936 RepID=A0A0E9TMU3_ANGAN